MRLVEPKIFLVGETRIIPEGLQAYLEHIGVPEWKSDASTDVEKLTEVMGRMCYKSFKPGLNPNVKRVRKTNLSYITNTLEKGDGSIFEHAVLNFIFVDVSRVFTHELVRHRVGVAISQESLRFVRLTDIGFWPPISIRENEKVMEIMSGTVQYLEQLQKELSEIFELDKLEDFDKKKKLTSAMRRIAPIGLATAIGWSANIRTLRHVIEMRTHPGAEEEIRYVFGKVAELVRSRYPNLFADYEIEIVDGLPWWKTKNKKV